MSSKYSKDRPSLCTFTFSDGRRCRVPRRPGHPSLCGTHARREAHVFGGDQAGKDIARHLSGEYVTACDLSAALGRLFSAVAQGHLKPKTAATLAYLGQTLVQTLTLAQHEYINSFGADSWRHTIRASFAAKKKAEEPQLLLAPPPSKPVA